MAPKRLISNILRLNSLDYMRFSACFLVAGRIIFVACCRQRRAHSMSSLSSLRPHSELGDSPLTYYLLTEWHHQQNSQIVRLRILHPYYRTVQDHREVTPGHHQNCRHVPKVPESICLSMPHLCGNRPVGPCRI